jgi:hypothetical protein
MVEPMSCENYPQYADLPLLSSMFHKVSSGLAIPVLTNAEERVVETIASFHPIVKVSSGDVRSSPALGSVTVKSQLPLPLTQVDSPVYPEFEGKTVGFFGVPPSILGSTNIVVPSRTPYQNSICDVAFISSVDNIVLALKSRSIFAPQEIEVPGYVRGKKRFKGYVEWQKKFEIVQNIRPDTFFSRQVELEELSLDNYLLPSVSTVRGVNVAAKYPITARFRSLMAASPGSFLGRVRNWLYALEPRLLYRDFLKRSNAQFSLERKKFDEVMQWLLNEKYVIKDGEWYVLVFLD